MFWRTNDGVGDFIFCLGSLIDVVVDVDVDVVGVGVLVFLDDVERRLSIFLSS